MKNQAKTCDKHLEILADLILRLQYNKRGLIERISHNLWKRNKKARHTIYLGLFNKREIKLLVNAYTHTMRSVEGYEQFPDLNVVFEFDYHSLKELEQLMASIYEEELKLLPAGRNMLNKYNLSAIWLEHLCSDKNLSAMIRGRLNAILDKSLTFLHENLKYQILNCDQRV